MKLTKTLDVTGVPDEVISRIEDLLKMTKDQVSQVMSDGSALKKAREDFEDVKSILNKIYELTGRPANFSHQGNFNSPIENLRDAIRCSCGKYLNPQKQ